MGRRLRVEGASSDRKAPKHQRDAWAKRFTISPLGSQEDPPGFRRNVHIYYSLKNLQRGLSVSSAGGKKNLSGQLRENSRIATYHKSRGSSMVPEYVPLPSLKGSEVEAPRGSTGYKRGISLSF